MTATKKTRKRRYLPNKVKAFIVQELACYATPTQAAKAVKEAYGVEMDRRKVECYDPTKYAGRQLSEQWRVLFQESREAFHTHVTDHVPLANKCVRVAKLARAAESYEAFGNYIAMADMLERIAKEMGNVHTNRREVTGKDRGPLQYEEMTDEQIRAEILSLVGRDAEDDDGAEPESTRH